MEILNDTVVNSRLFEIIAVVLKNHYLNRKNLKPVISYNEFRDTIKAFVLQVMKSLLKDTEYEQDPYKCIIETLPNNTRGQFNRENNELYINEDVIKKLYSGKIDELTTIFHELSHFVIKYELKQGIINADLIKIIKDELVSKDQLIDKYINTESLYYTCNYPVYSEEKIVDNRAIKIFLEFIVMTGINLSNDELDKLRKDYEKNDEQYHNYLRDFRLNIGFNSNWLDLEEAFDILIKHEPSWLNNPLLSIEYYKDKDGNIRKRTNDELQEKLSVETDNNMKECIQEILKMRMNKKNSKDFAPEPKPVKPYFESEYRNNVRKN